VREFLNHAEGGRIHLLLELKSGQYLQKKFKKGGKILYRHPGNTQNSRGIANEAEEGTWEFFRALQRGRANWEANEGKEKKCETSGHWWV